MLHGGALLHQLGTDVAGHMNGLMNTLDMLCQDIKSPKLLSTLLTGVHSFLEVKCVLVHVC